MYLITIKLESKVSLFLSLSHSSSIFLILSPFLETSDPQTYTIKLSMCFDCLDAELCCDNLSKSEILSLLYIVFFKF